MKVIAPGKLILSGEHAVVYGNPALAMAINRYATATISREMREQILFDLADLAHRSRLSIGSLRHLKDRVKRKYLRFIRGEYSIRDVLQKPFELAHFALSVFAETFNFALPHGVKIHVQSDIPIGCGMGSSAATILSVMHAVSTYLDLSLSEETLFRLALEAENMQHGHSSGLDLRVALQGGCLYVHGQTIEKRAVPTPTMYLIHTGTPITTTGQCVEHVAPHFSNRSMNDDFAALTIAMDHALQQQTDDELQRIVQSNHRLLVKIGVVPQTVQMFIAAIEKNQGAAKICGSGAIAGEQAGAVLVFMQDESALLQLCQRFNYRCMQIRGETRGVCAI